jgi:hypothetical protein
VLDSIAELSEDSFVHVEWILGHEIDSDTLRADQPYDLLNLVFKNFRYVVEQEVGFVKEEDQATERSLQIIAGGSSVSLWG